MATLPPNSVALLRICTEKSRLGFGRYGDITVGDIMKVDDDYIAYAYYCIPKITFTPEILAKYGITPIAKPGTNEQAFKDWKQKYREQFTEEQLFHGRVKFKVAGKRKAKAKAIAASRRECMSKGKLMAINHGHIDYKNQP